MSRFNSRTLTHSALFIFLTFARVQQTSASPSLNIAREGTHLAITFTGKLEAAENVLGPWLVVTNATNIYLTEPARTGQFFRARETASIFASTNVLDLSVAGPFQTNFNLAFAGTPDGIFPPKRQKPYFDAQLQMGLLELPVTMRVRGNSSLQECSFPKLKLKVSKDRRAGTPFEAAREIKIGTHCAEGGRGNIGRLRDERAAWREALAYEVMDALGFIAPRVRRAIINYKDTGETNEFGTSGWLVTRHAFLAEDVEIVADRLAGRVLSDEEIAVLSGQPFEPQLVTDLLLLHALLGNWDFSVEAEGRGVWNTEVIERTADKALIPVAGDFDLASFVTEIVRLSTPRDYHPELEDVERQALYTVSDIHTRIDATHFNSGRVRFQQKRAAVEAKINTAEVDEPGRTNALRHVSAFYSALERVSSEPGKAALSKSQ